MTTMSIFNRVSRLLTSGLLALAGSLIGLLLLLGCAAQADGACANEQLRSENNSTALPDCRAYEMVSPAYTEGFNVRKASVAAVANVPFGSGVYIGQSFGIFGGAENTNKFGGRYLFTRAETGWSTTPFEPPFSQFVDMTGTQEPWISPDLRSSVWELGSALPGSTAVPNRSYYLRNPAGVYTAIGPDAPVGTKAGAFSLQIKPTDLGASSDLSHFVFSSKDELEGEPFWLDDETFVEHPSLYEYVGTHNTAPTRVGVTGGAGSTDEISQCGTSLGANVNPTGFENTGGSLYNAVSVTGTTIFFTAAHEGCEGFNPQTNKEEEEGEGPPVDEIYARIDDERTVAISEPTTGAGGDCETCQEGSLASATYLAASADGSKALFITTQKLLPADTDSTSDLYEYDFNAPAGHKVIQISAGGSGDPTPGAGAGVVGLTTVSPDLSHIYFVATGILTTTPNARGQEAKVGQDNLYGYESDLAHPGESKTVFIGALESSDSADWAGFKIYKNNNQVTPDGRLLLFSSSADLTSDDTSTASQLFQYDSQTGDLIRVSKGQEGYNNDGNGKVAVGNERLQSSDGAYVVFDSTVPLTPQAATSSGFNNVYEYHNGNVYLISDGHDTTGFVNNRGSEVVGVSPSGADIYFTTGDPLLPSDTNTQVGIYDAREGGGFPLPAITPACSEDACQGQPSPSSVAQTPASSNLSGAGNLAPLPSAPILPPPAKCPKGKKLSRGKCAQVKTRNRKGQKKRPRAKRFARKTSHNLGRSK